MPHRSQVTSGHYALFRFGYPLQCKWSTMSRVTTCLLFLLLSSFTVPVIPLFLAFRLAYSPMDGRIERNLHDVGPIFQHPAFLDAADEEKHIWRAANQQTRRRSAPWTCYQVLMKISQTDTPGDTGSELGQTWSPKGAPRLYPSCSNEREPFVDDWVSSSPPRYLENSLYCFTGTPRRRYSTRL